MEQHLVRLRRRRCERCGSVVPRARLICMPYAGGSATVFRPWREVVPSDIDILAVEYAGHGSRIAEPLIERIDTLGDAIADALQFEAAVPYVMFGHSMGSLVAFELCHALAKRRAPLPILLVVAGHRGPHEPAATAPVHAAPNAQFVAHLRDLGATPPEVLACPELLDLMLPILRNDFHACETYCPPRRPPLPVSIAVYGGLADAETDRDGLLAWKRETSVRHVLRMFPGGHFFIRESAARVVAMLQRDLTDALADRP